MRHHLGILLSTLVTFYSCNKDDIEPVSSIKLEGDTTSVLKVGTSDVFKATSQSLNYDSILWDFGDGRISRKTSVLISYPRSGTYTLKLIAKNNNGETSVSVKQIIVLDRVLKRIDFYFAQWDTTNYTEPWPRTNTINIYFQMQKYTDDSLDTDGFYRNCPILYTSPLINDISNKFTSSDQPSFVVNVSEKIVIDKTLVRFATGNLNNAYLFSIMGQDSSGNKYRLTNNSMSGFPFGIIKEDISNNLFVITQGGLTYYNLICDYE